MHDRFMFAEAMIIGTALLALGLSVEAARRVVLRALDATKRNNELLAIDRHRPDTTEEVSRLDRAVAMNYQSIIELQAAQATLTLAVDEGVRHVKRAEKRVARTIQVTNKKLEEHGLEHPGLEAELDELRDLDGDGGEDGRMRIMPSELDPPEEDREALESGIPGYGG